MNPSRVIPEIMKKPKIKYPCTWTYKIFGTDKSSLRRGVNRIMKNRKNNYNLNFSNKSRSGKYVSMSLQTTVSSEKVRNEIYNALKEAKEVVVLF